MKCILVNLWGKPQKENVLKKVFQTKAGVPYVLEPSLWNFVGEISIHQLRWLFHEMGVHRFMYPHSKVPKCKMSSTTSMMCINESEISIFWLLDCCLSMVLCLLYTLQTDRLDHEVVFGMFMASLLHVDMSIMKVQAFKEQLRNRYQNCGSFYL